MSTRGSARAALLGALAVAALAGLAYVSLRGPAEAPGRDGAERSGAVAPTAAPAKADAAAGDSPFAGGVRLDPSRGPVAAGPIRVDRPEDRGAEAATFERSYDGTGTIAVDVRVAPGADFPERWTLHFEPSPFAAGRDHAERRTREFTGAERAVEETDLPMAAYRVFATAPGLASLPQEVILHLIVGQEHLSGVNFVRVGMTLQPAGVVAGTVLTAGGGAADELAVTLRALGADRRLTTTTRANGTYDVADVPPGEYALLLGNPDQPLVPPQRVEVLVGRTEAPTLTLPELVHLEVRAIDHLERPVPGAALAGYRREAGGGALRGTTGPDGVLRVRYLQPGAWRFDGTHAELGLAGRHDATLAVAGDGKTGAGPDGVQRFDVYLARTEAAR